ncbi:MAG: hypothetical protein EBS01_10425 [Verrucomicrobia bacterium]|nr:hypothetical protein [Verrucomicrobiota bacterium]
MRRRADLPPEAEKQSSVGGRAKKLQPPEAIRHSEGCCSPQNEFNFSRQQAADKSFFQKKTEAASRAGEILYSTG